MINLRKTLFSLIASTAIISTASANDFEEMAGPQTMEFEESISKTEAQNTKNYSDIQEGYNLFGAEDIYLFNYQSIFLIPEATLNITGESEGLYILDNYDVKHQNNQFLVDLDFKTIKEGNVNFTKKIGLSIMYAKGNKNIWIKYNNKVYKHLVPNKIMKNMDGDKIQIIDKVLDLELDNLKLTLIIPEID